MKIYIYTHQVKINIWTRSNSLGQTLIMPSRLLVFFNIFISFITIREMVEGEEDETGDWTALSAATRLKSILDCIVVAVKLIQYNNMVFVVSKRTFVTSQTVEGNRKWYDRWNKPQCSYPFLCAVRNYQQRHYVYDSFFFFFKQHFF